MFPPFSLTLAVQAYGILLVVRGFLPEEIHCVHFTLVRQPSHDTKNVQYLLCPHRLSNVVSVK
jgi:hypothetical protein